MIENQNIAPLVDPVAPRLGYLLRRASSVMMADLGTALASVDLRPVEATILILVGANPGCTQSDLGRSLGIKRANMVPLIAGLTSKTLLIKRPVDRRSVALSLTDDGDRMRTIAETIMDRHEAQFQASLAGVDQETLRAALTLIAGHRPTP